MSPRSSGVPRRLGSPALGSTVVGATPSRSAPTRARRCVGGKAVEGPYPVLALSLREGASHLPRLPDAPARLVAGISGAVTGVLGDEVREQLVSTLESVPQGRSGIAGTLVRHPLQGRPLTPCPGPPARPGTARPTVAP
ncbi:hypothetical protein [Streptomyces sp. NPDC088925]|uniref:hypothetical protein n=1 Tax=Streptomyces sp. NPDC088925 TaxID=3365914 RepID=UPI0037F651F5